MAVYYYNSLTSNLTANSYTYLQQVNPNATVTPTPTATPIVTVTPSPTAAPAGWQTRTYTYGTAHPHAVSSLTSGASTLGLYSYDANGNMTCRTENGAIYKQVYNTENRIASIQKIAAGDCNSVTAIDTQWDFAYDGDGVRTATLTTHYENGIPLPVEFSAYYITVHPLLAEQIVSIFEEILMETFSSYSNPACFYMIPSIAPFVRLFFLKMLMQIYR